MRWPEGLIIFVLFLFLSFCLWAATPTLVTIQDGKINVTGGYLSIGPSVTESTVTAQNLTGQCIGILCGVTHAD